MRTARDVPTPWECKKDHDLAHDFLLGPGGDDALRPARADAIHLAQALRRGLNDIEDLARRRP